MDLRLNGKRVLVTNGTRGIGRAIIEGFLEEGAIVGFCARDSGEVEAAQEALSARGHVVGSMLDVGDAAVQLSPRIAGSSYIFPWGEGQASRNSR